MVGAENKYRGVEGDNKLREWYPGEDHLNPMLRAMMQELALTQEVFDNEALGLAVFGLAGLLTDRVDQTSEALDNQAKARFFTEKFGPPQKDLLAAGAGKAYKELLVNLDETEM